MIPDDSVVVEKSVVDSESYVRLSENQSYTKPDPVMC